MGVVPSGVNEKELFLTSDSEESQDDSGGSVCSLGIGEMQNQEKPVFKTFDESSIAKPNSFVVVKLVYGAQLKKPTVKYHLGKVEKEEDGKLVIKFMQKSDKVDDVYLYPQVDDEQLISPEQVDAEVNPRQVIRGRHFFPKTVRKYNCA